MKLCAGATGAKTILVMSLALAAYAPRSAAQAPGMGDEIPVTATANPETVTAGQPVKLTADAKAVAGIGPPYSYSWDFGDGTPGEKGQTVNHTYAKPGTYMATVMVVPDFDFNGPGPGRFASGFASASVIVQPSLFYVVVTADKVEGPAPLTVKFGAVVSGGKPPYTFSWDFGDPDGDNTSTSQNPTHTYSPKPIKWVPLASVDRIYMATVTATDSTGAQSMGSMTVIVDWFFSWLFVTTSAAPTMGFAPLAVGFSAGASGGIGPYTYSWDFGDGQSATGPAVSHTYPNPGSYTVTVSVTDSGGFWTAYYGFATAGVVIVQPKMVGPGP